MALPPRSTAVPHHQSNASSFSTNSPVIPNPFASEALELQSNILGIQQQLQNSFTTLQHQISVGVTRINRLVEMANKAGSYQPEVNMSNTSSSSGSSGFASSGTAGGGYDLDSERHRSQLHRIPERPTVTVTGRKVDIETPADSMRSSMAVLSPHTTSSGMLASTAQTSQSGTSFIVLPAQSQHDRYQYHDPKQVASEQVSVQALPVSLAALPVLQLQQANSKFDSISMKRGKVPKREGTTKSTVSQMSVRPPSQQQLQAPPSPNLGVRWESRDYLKAGGGSQNASRKALLLDVNVKRAKSTSYEGKFEKSEPLIAAMRRKIEPPIESISMDNTNSSVSPSATSIGKWVSKIVMMGSDSNMKQGAASANNLDIARLPPTNSIPQKQQQMTQSRRQSIGATLATEEEATKQSRSPLFNVIHSVDMVHDNTSQSNSYSMDVAPSESGHSEQKNLNYLGKKENTTHFAPTRQIFEKQEVFMAPSDYYTDKASVISSRKESQSSGIVVERFMPPPVSSAAVATAAAVAAAAASRNPLPTTRRMSEVPKPNKAKKANTFRRKTWTEFVLFSSMFEDRGFDYFLSTEDLGQAGGEVQFTGIHTNSPFATIFNILMIFFYFFLIFYLPFRAAYFERFSYGYSSITYTASALLVLDSIVSFFTPPMAQRKSSKQLRIPEPLGKWQRFYLQYYGLIDVFSAIPWTEILDSQSILFPICMLALIRTFRLPRMMSQNPLIEYFHTRLQNTGGLGNSLTQILSIGVILVIFVHVQACVLYHIGAMNGFSNWEKHFEHWGVYSGGIEMAPPGDRYVWMVLESIGNIFPLEFRAGTNSEQIASFFFSTIGAFLYAALIGLISSAAISYDAPGKLYRQKIDELTEYLNWKNIDKRTKKKLLDYYDFKYRGKYFEESSLLADMNESLRREISMMNCKRLIEKVPFLKRNCGDGRDDIFMGKIATALVPVFFVPGDYVFNQGERSTEMFFVLSGTVNIIVNGCIVASFDDGNFFGGSFDFYRILNLFP
ncbi:hypothetical protein BDR26DRAFT_499854 [Obelidium mucronatum]|nr:hypothetical protein BDR26DRAFT_499854 [Obelidium mucronatum]